MDEGTIYYAQKLIENGETTRRAAVFAVDASHRYTLEFSDDPERHAKEYDELEARLKELSPSEREER